MTSTKTVLFVCTGNIFRSMTAEYALRATLEPGAPYEVNSAGLMAAPHGIVPFVEEYLNGRGIDVSGHRPRMLDAAMLRASDLTVAMDFTHRQQIIDTHAVSVPLFSEVAYETETPLPDVNEVIADWQNNLVEAREYGWSVMDTIFDGMPGLLSRLPVYTR